MDPLDILLPELWPLIFKKVEDPQDWLNLYRASPTFEGIVGDERPQALFSQVFTLVEKHYLNLKVNLKELLGLRLVSRQWRKLVDSILETPEGFGTDVREHEQEGMYAFMDPVSISSFLETFSTHPENPFVGRTVMVIFDDHINETEEAMAEFERLVSRLMERFGEHIKKLYVGSSENNPMLDHFLRRLQTILAFAPNLESLGVPIFGREGIDFRLENPILEDQQQFPIISKLKYFTFATTIEAQWDVLAELQKLIVSMCCNPDSLKAAEVIGVPSELATTCPNLDTAILRVTPLLDEFGIPSNTSWPLLTRVALCPDPAMKLHQVHACLEPFRETLIALTIHGPWKRNGKKVLKFDLPHLKYLKLTLRPGDMDLLTSLSNLEMLRISVVFNFTGAGGLSEDQRLKNVTNRIETEMRKFRVWEVLPKLRKIQLEGWIRRCG